MKLISPFVFVSFFLFFLFVYSRFAELTFSLSLVFLAGFSLGWIIAESVRRRITANRNAETKKFPVLFSYLKAIALMLLVLGVMHLLGFSPEQLKDGLTAGIIVLGLHLGKDFILLYLSKKKDKGN